MFTIPTHQLYLLTNRVKWKFLIVSVLGFMSVTILFKSSGLSSFFVGIDSANPFYEFDYFVQSLQFNTSLKALIFNLDFITLQIFNFRVNSLIENYFVLYLLYCLVAFALIQNKNFRQDEKILAGAIISISISLVAVFIPIFFMPGPIGLLFREFAVVVSLSITIFSAVPN